MADNKNRGEADGHECRRRHERTRRQSRQSTYAMPAGAARAQTRTETDQRARYRKNASGGRKRRGDWRPPPEQSGRRAKQSGDESEAPQGVIDPGRQEAPDNAADPRNPANAEDHHGGRHADQRAARQRAQWREMSPVNLHGDAFSLWRGQASKVRLASSTICDRQIDGLPAGCRDAVTEGGEPQRSFAIREEVSQAACFGCAAE